MKNKLKNWKIKVYLIYIILCIIGAFIYIEALHMRDKDYKVSRYPSSLTDIDKYTDKVSNKEFNQLVKLDKIDSIYANFVEPASEKIYFTKINNKKLLYQTANPNTEDIKNSLLEKGINVYPINDLIHQKFNLHPEESWANYILICLLSGVVLSSTVLFIHFKKKKEPIKSREGYITTSSGEEVKIPDKKFSDIGGLSQLKDELQAIVDFLKYPEKYQKAGASLPRGILLVGPPGTGKTVLAKAIAAEAKVNFVYANASDFVEMFVGVGAKRVRELFEKAKKSSPSIVFIDEIDTICAKRSGYNDHAEDRKALTALMTEMDGFSENDNLLVIGATNRLEDLDDAIKRAGRFTDIYTVPIPETTKERLEVINIYMKGKKFAKDFNKNQFAEEMIGRSPAEIEEIFNEAAILSVRKRLKSINKECIEEAIYKRLLHGHKGDNLETCKEDLKLIAYHEAGHTLIAKLGGASVTKVTILPSTSGAGGVTFIQPPKRKLYTKEMLEQKIMESYAGRAGEYLISNKDWNKTTQGCSNDIEQATKYLKQMVDAYGMSDIGMINMNILSQDTQNQSIAHIKKLAKELQNRTVKTLEDNFELLDKLAKTLLEKETIYEDEIDKIIFGR